VEGTFVAVETLLRTGVPPHWFQSAAAAESASMPETAMAARRVGTTRDGAEFMIRSFS
jgi:hypothetical protein